METKSDSNEIEMRILRCKIKVTLMLKEGIITHHKARKKYEPERKGTRPK